MSKNHFDKFNFSSFIINRAVLHKNNNNNDNNNEMIFTPLAE